MQEEYPDDVQEELHTPRPPTSQFQDAPGQVKAIFRAKQTELTEVESDYNEIPDKTTMEAKLYLCIIKTMLFECDALESAQFFQKETKGKLLQTIDEFAQLLRKRISIIPMEVEGQLTKLKEKIRDDTNQETNLSLSGSLLIIKKELFSIDVFVVERLIKKALLTKDKISGQRCIVFVGDTGSGKTTLIKALLGYRMCMKKYRDIDWLTTADPITDPEVLAMQSCPKSKSVTRYISAVQPQSHMTTDKLYLVDTPGFKDTGGIEVELANSFGVVKALEQCSEISIVLVISIESWGTRGSGFKALAKSLSDIINDITKNKASIAYCFNRFGPDLDAKLKEMLDELTAIQQNDTNFMKVMQDLKQKHARKKLMIFDLLDRDVCREKLADLIDLQVIQRTAGTFKCVRPSNDTLSRFNSEYKSAIEYYFVNENPEMVKYFLKQYQVLANRLEEVPTIEQHLKEIKEGLVRRLETEFSNITKPITNSIKYNTLEESHIRDFYIRLQNQERRGAYGQILDGLQSNWTERGLELSLKIAEDLEKDIEEGLAKAEAVEDQVAKKLSNLYLLKKCESPSRTYNIKINEVQERVTKKIILISKDAKKEYINNLNKEGDSNYHEATESLKLAKRMLRYQKIIDFNDEDIKMAIDSALLNHVNWHAKRFGLPSKRISESDAINLAELDRRLTRILDCSQLVEEQNQDNKKKINNLISDFHQTLEGYCDEEQRLLKESLDRQEKLPLAEFQRCMKCLHFLEKIMTISERAKFVRQNARHSIQSFLEVQKKNLEKISEELEQDPKRIRKHLLSIIGTLNRINNFKELVEEDLQRKIEAVESDIRGKVSSSVQTIVDQYSSDYRIHFAQVDQYQKQIQNLLSLLTLQNNCMELGLRQFKNQLNAIGDSTVRLNQQITTALNEAKRLIEDIDLKPDSSVEFQNHWEYVPLEKVEDVLNFTQFSERMLSHGRCGELCAIAKEININAKRIFQKLRNDMDERLKLSMDRILKAEAVDEGCRKCWSNVRRLLAIYKEIEASCKIIKDYGIFEEKRFKNHLGEYFREMFSTLKKKFASAGTDAKVIEQLLEKCNIFTKADQFLHPELSTIRGLMREIEDCSQRLRRGTKEQSTSLLQRGDFDQFRIYRETLKSEPKLYDEATNILKLQYPACMNELTKRQRRKRQVNWESMLRVAEIYSEYVALKKCVGDLVNTSDLETALTLLSSQLRKYMEESVSKIIKCVQEGELACAINHNLALRNFEEGSPIDIKELMAEGDMAEIKQEDIMKRARSYKQCERMIDEEINSITKKLRKPNIPDKEVEELYAKYFNKRENFLEVSSNKLKVLTNEWNKLIWTHLEQAYGQQETAKDRKDELEGIRKAEKYRRLLPQAKQQDLTQLEQKVSDAKDSTEKKFISKMNNLERSEIHSANIEILRECLLYFNTHESQRMEGAVKSFTQGFWDRRLKELTSQNSIKVCIELYDKELRPLFQVLKICKQATSFVLVLKNSFMNSCRLFINEFQTKIRKIANMMKESPINASENEDMLTSIEEFFETLRRMQRTQELPEICRELEEVCNKTIDILKSAFKDVMSKKNFKEILEGTESRDCTQSFESLRRFQIYFSKIKECLGIEELPDTHTLSKLKDKVEQDWNKCSCILHQFRTTYSNSVQTITDFNIDIGFVNQKSEAQHKETFKIHKSAADYVRKYLAVADLLSLSTVNVDEANQKLVQAIVGYETEVCAKISNFLRIPDIRKFKEKIMMIQAYDSIYLTAYTIKITEKLKTKLQETEENCIARANECFESNEKWIEDFNKFEKEELARYEANNKTQKETHDKSVEDIRNELQNQINAAENEMEEKQLQEEMNSRVESKEVSFKFKQAQLKKRLSESLRKEEDRLKRTFNERLLAMVMCILQLKAMEVAGLSAVKNDCTESIKSILATISRKGTPFCNVVANCLHESRENYSSLLLQNSTFASFNKTLFKKATDDIGAEEISKTIPGLKHEERLELLSKFNKYLSLYKQITGQYSKSPSLSIVDHIKGSLNGLANNIAIDYQSRNRTERGEQLVAYIFALWSIIKADVCDRVVLYLYEPHPAQVMTVFLLLGICCNKRNSLEKGLAQVLTGEGKSVVLACLSCYLALVKFNVSCVCYSRALSQRDYNAFLPLFEKLEILDYVTYGTFSDIADKEFNSQPINLDVMIRDILINDKNYKEGWWSSAANALQKIFQRRKDQPRKKVLLVDQVDVFFDKEYFGGLYNITTTIETPAIKQLATYIWNHRDQPNLLEIIWKSAEYAACSKQLHRIPNLLKSNVIEMVQCAKNFKHNYVIQNNSIVYSLKEGLATNVDYGWKTTFAYYYEIGQGTISGIAEKYAKMSILCAEMSYAELPKRFDLLMGVTGTLKNLPRCEEGILRNEYQVKNFFEIPSAYGVSRRMKYLTKIVPLQDFPLVIIGSINRQIQKKRPVLVFFSDDDTMNNFSQSPYCKELRDRLIIFSEKNKPTEIEENIVFATLPGNVSFVSRALGRGTDFVSGEKGVNEGGGVHVIQTFISEEESESTQIEGRTARQGQKGSYQLLLSDESVLLMGLDPAALLMMNGQQINQTLNKRRNELFEIKFQDQIKNAIIYSKNHKLGMEIQACINHGENDEVRQKITSLNMSKANVVGKAIRIVIGIDATVSMGHALAQVLMNIRVCLERLQTILQEQGANMSFEIQIATYRNYSSGTEKIFESSPFSNKANDLINFLKGIKAQGGQGNEAIETLFHHILYTEPDIGQLIVIGDAIGNTPYEIANKRQHTHSSGEYYWQSSRYPVPLNPTALLNEIVQRKIPIQSFYIGKKAEQYFREISSHTGGQAEEYIFAAPDASQRLTDFIVKAILAKMGGSAYVNAYIRHYSRNV